MGEIRAGHCVQVEQQGGAGELQRQIPVDFLLREGGLAVLQQPGQGEDGA